MLKVLRMLKRHLFMCFSCAGSGGGHCDLTAYWVSGHVGRDYFNMNLMELFYLHSANNYNVDY